MQFYISQKMHNFSLLNNYLTSLKINGFGIDIPTTYSILNLID